MELVILALLIAILISGCSTKKQVNSSQDTKGIASGNGGTLVIARLSDAENLDHHFMSTINAASVTHNKIYEGLVGRDKNAEIKPVLAEKWEQLDETTWEFKLREDVTFHDGTAFNADAVKATFDRLLDPDVASPRAVVFKMVEEVKAVDEFTVQFKLSEPFSPLLSILANHEGGIISPKTIEKYGKKLFKNLLGQAHLYLSPGHQARKLFLTKMSRIGGLNLSWIK